MDAERETAAKKAAEATARANAEEAERVRKAAWLNYRVDQARAQGDEAFAAFLNQPTENLTKDLPMGFPPGQSHADYQILGIPEDEPAADSILTRAFAKHGMKI